MSHLLIIVLLRCPFTSALRQGSGGGDGATVVRKVEPVYPEAARRSNVQGTVVLGAVIAADGTVVNLHPVSGPDGLISAAMDAARWWHFRPYRVQGDPTPVETSLNVEFRQ